MALILDGRAVKAPNLSSISFHDLPELRLRPGEDCRPRARPDVRGIVLHTTKGIPGGKDKRRQEIRPGFGPRVDAGLRCARYWRSSVGRDGKPVKAGAHLVVDHDGQIACCADLVRDAANHAGPVNDLTIGIEIYQGAAAELYELQLEVVVRLVDWLTRQFQIQRQIPHKYLGPIGRLAVGGRSFYGVYGHRDITSDRGRGDPGDAVFDRFSEAGYEDWDINVAEDIAVWKKRQKELGITPLDGIAGPRTVAALVQAGRPHGIWVRRPGDEAPLVS